MEAAFIFDEQSKHIGTLTINAYPYGDAQEERQGICTRTETSGTGVSFVTNDKRSPKIGFDEPGLVSESITEYITIQHTIQWEDARQYPSEVAFIESYPGNYYEIGQRVNGTWVSAGTIDVLECRYEEGDEDGIPYLIRWLKAFQHLPPCSMRVYTVQE